MNTEYEAEVAEFKRVAGELSQRIELFEEWLNTRGGNTKSSVQDVDLIFGIQREGNAWYLSVETEKGVRPVRGASLDIKIRAIHRIPSILQAMQGSRKFLVGEMRKAIAAFDESRFLWGDQ